MQKIILAKSNEQAKRGRKLSETNKQFEYENFGQMETLKNPHVVASSHHIYDKVFN